MTLLTFWKILKTKKKGSEKKFTGIRENYFAQISKICCYYQDPEG